MLLFAVMMSVSMSAEVLFSEEFSVGVGTLVESNNGWFTPYDGASGVSITNGLEFPDYVMSGVGNAVLLNGNCGQYQPHHSFAEVSQGSVYVSFMFQPFVVGKAGWFFCLRDAYSQSTFNYVARIHLSADGLLGLRFYKTAEAGFDETMPLDGQNTYLVVLKYTIVEGDHNDQISLYAFDTMPAAEPVTPLVGPLTDAQAPDICPQNIVLRAFDADSWFVLDGIRVATTWQEAVAALTSALTTVSDTQSTDTQCYNILGQPVSDSYHGLVIQRGSKYRRMRIFSL